MNTGIYIHIPFCISKCIYCDFVSFPLLEGMMEDYGEALEREIKASPYKGIKIDTIFFGGGTPTIFPLKSMERIVNTLNKNFIIDNNVEFTIEGNPGTINEESLREYKNMGVNRLSIGLQSTQDRILKSLGRIHNYNEFRYNYQLARMLGFNNINIDLMFGVPNQSIKDWEETLELVTLLKPTHLSCYSLKVEESTPLYALVENGKVTLPTDETDRYMYHKTIEFLINKGYQHYEISNFSLPGFQCKHNMIYWELDNYIGYGVSAHSFFDSTRWENTRSIKEYIEYINTGKIPIINIEYIDNKTAISEFFILGLRKIQGIDLKQLINRFNPEKKELKKIVETINLFESQGLISRKGSIVALTKKGLDLSNIVLSEFL